jgi:hypothetical protein
MSTNRKSKIANPKSVDSAERVDAGGQGNPVMNGLTT